MKNFTIAEIKALTFEEVLTLINKGDIAEPVVWTLPLDSAINNKEIGLVGNYFSCINATDASVSASVRFNNSSGDALEFSQGLGFIRPFNKVFITASAQAGKTVTFLVSPFAPELFQVIDNRSNNLQANYLATIAGELKGSTNGTFNDDVSVGITAVKVLSENLSRKSFCIQSDYTNTGYIYIGFNNTVATDKKIACLEPGQSFMLDDYQDEIYCLSDKASQLVSASEW